ncbi:MAG: (Fe-S)-binding protein [Chloroflexi bacterium]|nr:(Fe-S)-binding protein [Chloroflexota bacterium]
MLDTETLVEQFGLLACIQCGKCTGGCPISPKSALNPRALIYQILRGEEFELVARDELWDCTTCSTCGMRCPKGVKAYDLIIGLRAQWIESGKIPQTLRAPLTATLNQGNPLVLAREDRTLWADGLGIKNVADGAEITLFTCCENAYDPRVQPMPKALVNIFRAANVDVGTLGMDEQCCGSEIRRIGEAGLFEYLRDDNIEKFKAANVKKLVTTSPHCYNVYHNEYGKNEFSVEHYTQTLAHLIADDKLKFGKKLAATITYQDPCFLGKQNGVYDEPRAVLKAIPGSKFIDMDRSRERSVCCEGGGGRMWLEGTNTKVRLANDRINQALETGANILATACPFCFLTLSDAVIATGNEDKIKVMDIAQIVNQVI